MYVVLEGIDTAGKSTQIELLKQVFEEAVFTSEPGGSELGMKLRKILLESEMSLSKEAEFLLFLSDRAEHIHRVILPNQDKLIISDRSLISGIAYAKDFDPSKVLEFNLFATQGILPDCVVLLELSQEELERRLSLKHQDRIEQRGVEFLLKIQERMIEACEALKIPIIRIDAGEKIDTIHQRILKSLS